MLSSETQIIVLSGIRHPMRTILTVLLIGLGASFINAPQAASDESSGWTDLLGRDLKNWARLESGPNPWRLTSQHSLICSAKVVDYYTPDRNFENGTIRFEYRLTSTAAKSGYRGAVYVRRTQESKGVRVDLGDDCGTIATPVASGTDRVKTITEKPSVKLAKRVGEWNDVEISMAGRAISVKVNGKPASTFEQCDILSGLIVFAGEGSEIEFRSVLWKAGK